MYKLNGVFILDNRLQDKYWQARLVLLRRLKAFSPHDM